MYVKRAITVRKELSKKSILLLGPRRTGKSAFIRNEIKAGKVYNLLLSDLFLRLSTRPSLIREELGPKDKLIVIDEIQKMPLLMDEVHYLIEEKGVRFLLTGSSARKLKRTHTSLMAGRVKTRYLHPFTSAEIKELDLKRVLNYGALPPVYLSDDPWDELRSYVGDYLKEEIVAEALTRKIDNFSRFLHTSAISNGELINFESVSRDAQVPSRTIREYYAILEDTLIGNMIEPLRSSGKRKTISTGKFYFFDIGVVNSIIGQRGAAEGTAMFGKAFEHFIYLEVKAFLDYNGRDESINFWRTNRGVEVDFVIGGSIAIEVKSSGMINEKHIKGLTTLAEEHPLKRMIVVSRDSEKRIIGNIEIYPVKTFLDALWNHEITD